MAQFAVIIAAAGKSTRFTKNHRKKPFVELKGRAVWLRSAELFVNRDDVAQTLVAVSPDDMEWFKDKFRPNLAFMDVEIVEGGNERADTVQNALARVRSDIEFVAIHDAARPLLVNEWIDRIFEAATRTNAAIPAVPVTATLKRINEQHQIIETVPREEIWMAQTPQVFMRQLLLDAYAQRGEINATDEACLLEQFGHPVSIVPGSPMNIKITTGDDFRMAEALLDALPKPKSLRALHPFKDEDPFGL